MRERRRNVRRHTTKAPNFQKEQFPEAPNLPKELLSEE